MTEDQGFPGNAVSLWLLYGVMEALISFDFRAVTIDEPTESGVGVLRSVSITRIASTFPRSRLHVPV